MSQTNIMSGFSTISIYILNHSALLPECPPSSLCQKTGLNFISLFTITRCRSSRRISEIHEELPLDSSPVPMQEQHSWDDYDLPLCSKDLSVFLSDEEVDDHFSSIANDHDSSSHLSTTPTEFSNLDYSSALSKVIKHSVPTLQFPQLEPKTSARILTSEENRRILREKEKEN